MEKSSTSDLSMGAVFMLCISIGWLFSSLVAGAIVGIALGFVSVIIYNTLKNN